jgi:DNA-binding IclR family transcriptional regulator
MGTLVLDRALKILGVLTLYDGTGLPLADIARRLGVPHPTVYRLLQDLLRWRLVTRLPDGRRYALGRTIYEFGLAARSRHDVSSLFRSSLERLTEKTALPAYLFVISGFDAVCYDHTSERRAAAPLTITSGGRRPLGVGAAGLALLAAQDDARVEAILRANAAEYGKFGGLDVPRLRGLIEETRSLGYCRSGGCLNTGTAAVGYAVRDAGGATVTAVSLSTRAPALRASQAERQGRLIRDEIEPLASRFRLADGERSACAPPPRGGYPAINSGSSQRMRSST